MREFFRGWRRKCGVLTLLVACVFAAGWVRSGVVNDFWATDGKNATYRLGSYGGMLNLIRETPSGNFGRFFHWDSFDEGENNKFELWAKWISWEGHVVHWQWDWGQFHFGAGTIMEPKQTRVDSFIIPYWSIVSPLILVSALLLFAKPRQSIQTKTAEPIPEPAT